MEQKRISGYNLGYVKKGFGKNKRYYICRRTLIPFVYKETYTEKTITALNFDPLKNHYSLMERYILKQYTIESVFDFNREQILSETIRFNQEHMARNSKQMTIDDLNVLIDLSKNENLCEVVKQFQKS